MHTPFSRIMYTPFYAKYRINIQIQRRLCKYLETVKPF
ncbi:hypothetical protein TREAZ_1341 [Leadbettera azotonutricia ZAS-9]|uniref:Uncharacterized protein n=1 Tax=Leadbettera azotonutricia (strain ATCC BAA-888 / DSM 13862 / ZAS-9) TaxID=545695 RepID=F5YFW6_LEAAZ|nr:hypothetical protein TREAZ_1341 [Leadbettera azotonutricia ZAS-9]